MAKKKIARVLDEEELEMIAWRAGRGCHFEGGFLYASEWGKQVIQEDVPLLIAEIRKLRAVQQSAHPTPSESVVNPATWVFEKGNITPPAISG